MNIREKVQEELDEVRNLIDGDADQERATLEGWEGALKWVLNQLEGEGE